MGVAGRPGVLLVLVEEALEELVHGDRPPPAASPIDGALPANPGEQRGLLGQGADLKALEVAQRPADDLGPAAGDLHEGLVNLVDPQRLVAGVVAERRLPPGRFPPFARFPVADVLAVLRGLRGRPDGGPLHFSTSWIR